MQVLALNAPELVENEKDDQPAPRPKRVALAGGNKLRTDVALGRMLFHAAGDGRISHDGRACASCHPDGRDDALTWATPEGPRRSILLAGRVASTAPYSWNGTNKTLHDHITRTFDRLNGTGLRSLELDALIEYVTSLRAPGTPEEDAAHDPKVARGAAIFASREAGCAGCHVQGMTFADGATHDIGSKAKADKSPRFDTPSLHLVGGTGPYFHDGRYADLKTLLRDTDGRMGSIHQLSEDDLDALVAYVRTL